jgi:SAM-dependent methyltransferase
VQKVTYFSNLYDFWQFRGEKYDLSDLDMKSQQMISDAIQKIKPKTLIDIGCGTGPMFQYYVGIKTTGVDWSLTMLQRALQKIQDGNLDITLFYCDVAGDWLPPGHFDCGVTRTTLMHIPPTRIEKAINNIKKLCDHVLIDELWEPQITENLAPWNWSHDYKILFEKCGFEMVDSLIREDIPHIFLHVKVKGTDAKQEGSA